MWILARLILAVAVFLVRLRQRAAPAVATLLVDRSPYYVAVDRRKGTRIGVPLQAPWFRLTRERTFDRLSKALGLAGEAQTGDAEFDRQVYVAGDHPALHELLRRRAEARAAIARAFELGFTSITSDGACLWLNHPGAREPEPSELRLVAELRAAFMEMEHHRWRRLRDPFFWKALVVEGVVWSILTYAVGGLVEDFVHDEDYHLRDDTLVGYGLVAALTMALLLLAAITLVLRGSSRAHLVLRESVVVLALGLPIAGVQAVSDLNRGLDDGPSVTVARTVARVEARRRGRRASSYHLYLEPSSATDAIDVPEQIRVAVRVYVRASAGATAELRIGPGWLGMPWYRGIEILP